MLSRESICCWEKLKMIEKKGQEEAVGFVAIVIIVSIVLLFILGIVLRQESSSSTGSLDVRQFLESTYKTTSECSLDQSFSYLDMDGLLIECGRNSGQECLPSGEKVCDLFNKTFSTMIERSEEHTSELQS